MGYVTSVIFTPIRGEIEKIANVFAHKIRDTNFEDIVKTMTKPLLKILNSEIFGVRLKVVYLSILRYT